MKHAARSHISQWRGETCCCGVNYSTPKYHSSHHAKTGDKKPPATSGLPLFPCQLLYTTRSHQGWQRYTAKTLHAAQRRHKYDFHFLLKRGNKKTFSCIITIKLDANILYFYIWEDLGWLLLLLISDENDPFSTWPLITYMKCNKMSLKYNVKNANVIVEPRYDKIQHLCYLNRSNNLTVLCLHGCPLIEYSACINWWRAWSHGVTTSTWNSISAEPKSWRWTTMLQRGMSPPRSSK